MKRAIPVREVDRGPITVGIGSAEGGVEDQPSVGIRKDVGFRP